MPRRPATWAVGALLLPVLGAGCARFVPQPLDPAERAVRLTTRRLDSRTWTLEALVQEAVRNHPDTKLARAQYETARAALVTAGERPNPTVSLSSQAPVQLRNFLTGTYGIDFDWTVETAGKRSRRLEIAHAGARTAAANLGGAIRKTRAAVRKALLEIHAGEQRGRILHEAMDQQGKLLAMFNQRVEAGAESRSSGIQIRLLQAQLRLQAAEAAKTAATARAALAAAMGLSAAALAEARFSFTVFERQPAERVSPRPAALTHRAEILAALAEYAAAEGTLRLEIAKQYPDLHLNPGYQLDDNVHKWNIGIGLTLPILNQNQGAIGEAEARRREAAAWFDFVQAKVLAECDGAAVALKAARRKLAVTDESLTQQEKQVENEQRLLSAGAADKLNWRTALVEQALARAARLDSWVEYQAAVGTMEEVTEVSQPQGTPSK